MHGMIGNFIFLFKNKQQVLQWNKSWKNSSIVFAGFTESLSIDAGVSMLGMLMIAVAILQFLYGVRMFRIARKLRQSEQTLQVCSR